MDILFLDANVFFAAAASFTGGSNFLFQLASEKKIRLISSNYAVQEAKLNIERKLGEEQLIAFYRNLSHLYFVDSKNISEKEFQRFQNFISQKDIPILVSAFRQKTDFLITLDRKDFMTKKLRETKLPFSIFTPGEYLQNFVRKIS